MNKITLNDFSFENMAIKMAALFETEVDSNCNSNEFKLPKKYGNGRIIGFDFDGGLGLFILKVKLREGVVLDFREGNRHPMYLMHNNEGVVVHNFCKDSIRYQLDTMHCSISACPCDSSQSVTLPAGQAVNFCCVSIDRGVFTEITGCGEDELPQSFIHALEDKKSENSFFYHGTSDFEMARFVQELCEMDFSKIENVAFAEGKTFEILGQFIRNYKENQSPDSVKVALNKYDIDCMMRAKEIITSNMEEPPTIPELAKLVGINQQKLKQGFKQVFRTTINQFLIKERMETARILLTEGTMNVSEVATRVGYSNKSHFSTKFKQHFGILPKEFSKNIEVNIPGASLS